MKKIFALIIVLTLLLGLPSCSFIDSMLNPKGDDDMNGDTPGPNVEDPADEMEDPVDEEPVIVLSDMTVEEMIEFFSFLSMPIDGAKVSSVNGQLPNAPRSYRNGVHEGLDFYNHDRGTPVLAAAAGKVIRADHDYIEMTHDQYEEVIATSMAEPITPEELLDKLRGRQVWIEHENGIITRYCHLDSIRENIQVNDIIEAGTVIAGIGNSGTESGAVGKVLSPSDAPHLHFEIWLGDTFLGQGLDPDTVRRIYKEVLK